MTEHDVRSRALLPRTPETRGEALALLAVSGVFLLLLLGALGYARREYRDGLRRHDLREIKTELERAYDALQGFPLHPSGDLQWCGSSDDPDDWFFTGFLKRERKRNVPLRDPRQSSGYSLRYCPTIETEADETPPLAAGFVLEATLENTQPDSARFNKEYNIFERTVTEHGRTLYRICGGIETQCGTERARE